MKLNRKTLVILSGTLWLLVGISLLQLGLGYLVGSTVPESTFANSAILLPVLSGMTNGAENAAIFVVCLSLAVGYSKGRFVLAKTVKRVVGRLEPLKGKVPVSAVFGPGYLALIGFMMGLGMMMKFLGVPADLRGGIDVAVGSALIHGAILYFRSASQLGARATVTS